MHIMHFWKPFSLFLRMLSFTAWPKTSLSNTVSSRSSGRAPEPFSLSECTWRLAVCFCATFAMIRPLARSILFRPGSASRRWASRVFCALAERILLRSSSLSVCHKEGIWLHKTSLPNTCMLSCLPESCCSACLILVVSSSLCAELITAYHIL